MTNSDGLVDELSSFAGDPNNVARWRLLASRASTMIEKQADTILSLKSEIEALREALDRIAAVSRRAR